MGHVHTRVAAVFNFIDAVTERPVRYKGLQLVTEQQNKVIWKDTDRAVVLRQDGTDCIDVIVSGKFYQEVRLHVELPTDAALQVHSMWLQPARHYPFRENMTIVRGTCSMDELYVLWAADNAKYKLSETTAVGSSFISLWGISGSVEGRMFLLCEDSEGGAGKDLVTLTGLAGPGAHIYRTRECMQHVFHRGKTKLYKAAKVCMDRDGNFFTAFLRDAQAGDEILFWSGGETVAALKAGDEGIVKHFSCACGHISVEAYRS